MYEPRTYRDWSRDKDLVSFTVIVKETDLFIRASKNLQNEAYELVLKYRSQLEKYIEKHPRFLTTLEPFTVGDDAPPIVKSMAEAASKVDVGPMAAVAGAIAELVGNELSALSPEVIGENGGDSYLKSLKDRMVGIYAGDSPFTGRIGVEINGQDTPMGICTSSGTVGPSLSFGKADAVTVLAKSATLADAAATAIGNLIVDASDIPKGIEFAKGVAGLTGVVIIKGKDMGLWGEVKIVKLA